ncbi:hypothetical protein [Methanobacterium oryzae]|uniref:hypothetical protein n=1 Tax=Methanobacterium oryzae TaxID=69540 RepID=UPI003D220F1E
MDQDRLILPAIIIIVVLAAVVLIVAFTGSNTFDSGNLYFEYPNSWSQDHVVGDFSNNSLYSEVTLTANIPNADSPTSYIVIQMQKKSQGTLKLPGTNEIVMNTTNSTVGTTNIGNLRATQLGTFGSNVAEKVTIIEKSDYYFVIEYICPPNAINQTESDYNAILQSLQIQ